MTRIALPLVALLLGGAADPGPMRPATGEPPRTFASRILGLTMDDEEPHVLATRWNDRPLLLVDFVRDAGRDVIALQADANGGWRAHPVTTGEEEGGTPDIAAYGFANADRDPADELIVLLRWNVHHYEVRGDMYEVRIFDDDNAGKRAGRLRPLTAVNRHFGFGCECYPRDGRPEHYRFRTIAAVKAELGRLGYRPHQAR